MLFDSKKQQTISLPRRTSADTPTTVADLINHLTDDLTQRHQKKELFVLDGSVCVSWFSSSTYRLLTDDLPDAPAFWS